MPDVTRRTAMTVAALGVAATLLPAMPAAAATTLPGRSAFESLRGSTVSLRGAGGTVHAVLVEVGDVTGAPTGSNDAYSLLLRPVDSVPDGMYRVSNPRLGRATLFLANVDRARAAGLEAIVNQHRP